MFSNQQTVFDVRNDKVKTLELPPPHAEVLPGVEWGFAESPFTPAFWASQLWLDESRRAFQSYRWSNSLKLEIVACLLGGHGITWEMNSAAFERLNSSGLLNAETIDADSVERCLRVPLLVNGRSVRYRFPRVRSAYIADAVKRFDRIDPPPNDDFLFREWLLSFRGIGMKTASWITRNHRGSRRVAIIDIHVYRAGVLMKLFRGNERLPQHYLDLETRYLAFARAIHCDPRRLDVLIWKTMKQAVRLVMTILRTSSY